MEIGSPQLSNTLTSDLQSPSLLNNTSEARDPALQSSVHIATEPSPLLKTKVPGGSLPGASDTLPLPLALYTSPELRDVPKLDSTTSTTSTNNINSSNNTVADSGNSSNLVARNVYISGLPPHFRPKDFRKMCQAFGHIEASKLSVDGSTRPTKGYGFALFYTEESAAACIEGLNGRELCGRTLQARFSRAAATPKEAVTRTPQQQQQQQQQQPQQQQQQPQQQQSRPSNTTQTRMNRTKPANPPLAGSISSIASPDNFSPVQLQLTNDQNVPQPVVYHQVSAPTAAWPVSTYQAPSYPQQLVYINGQYYTLPTTAAPTVSYYPVVQTSAEVTPVPSSPAGLPVSASPTPVQYTTLPTGTVPVPGYYFLPS